MNESRQITPRILVTTDFSRESERAFFHALAFAVRLRGRLTLLHTGAESRDTVPWDRFPGIRGTLSAWGLLSPDAARTEVADTLGLSVAKMAMRDSNPRFGITDYLRKHPTDLLVMATEGRTGIARLFNPSVAESVSHATRSYSLLLPNRGAGFVDPASGRSSLERVLWAIDGDGDPRTALVYLKQWLPILAGDNALEVTVLHVGDPAAAPQLALPDDGVQRWRLETRTGDFVATVAAAAREHAVGLVALSTRARLGPLGRMRGSRMDRLLRNLRVPLLSLPLL